MGLGDGGLQGLGIWGIASPKRGVVQLRDYLNAALSKCGVVALTLSLVLTLASCKNRNLVLTRVSCLRIEPPQVVCLAMAQV